MFCGALELEQTRHSDQISLFTMSSEVTERLRLRDEARRAALEEQRLEKEKITVEEHTTAYFNEEFSKKRTSIEGM